MCSWKFFTLGLSLLLAFVSGCALFAERTQNRGPILEEWETNNKAFRIRVTSYAETGANVNGAYYRFESAASASDDWREIVAFRHDDQPKIPSDQVRFLNDHTGYIFIGWIYAVTTDAGRTWSVWTAERDLPNWQCCNYGLIWDVRIANDGSGTMHLKPIQGRRGEIPELHTVDYGHHWMAK